MSFCHKLRHSSVQDFDGFFFSECASFWLGNWQEPIQSLWETSQTSLGNSPARSLADQFVKDLLAPKKKYLSLQFITIQQTAATFLEFSPPSPIPQSQTVHAPFQIYQILHQHRLFGPWSEGVNFKKTYFESTHFLFWKGQCAIWVWKRIPADQRLIPLPVPGPAPPGPRGQFFTSDGEVFGSLPISLQIIPHYTQICCRILGRDVLHISHLSMLQKISTASSFSL